MLLRNSLVTSVAIIGVAVGSPAMAQSSLNFQQATGVLVQGATQDISATSTGLNSIAAASQLSANGINLIGDASLARSVAANFSFGQAIGPVDPIATPSGAIVDQRSSNLISAAGTGLNAFGSLDTALFAGGQATSNRANSAALALAPDANGTVQQVINDAASTLFATNRIEAIAGLGNASALGNGFGQVASNSLNSAALLASDTASIELIQKAPAGNLAALQANQALVSIVNSASPNTKSSVTNLSQASYFGLNSLVGQGAGQLNLKNGGGSAGQDATFAAISFIDSYNTQDAVNSGPVQILGSSQNSGLSVNTVSNTGATALGDSRSGFTQRVDANNLNAIATNSLVAQTSTGNALVTGAPFGSSNSTVTQSNSINLNSLTSGGAVGGTLGQSSESVSPILSGNTSAALTDSGNATLTSVSQVQAQGVNTLSGAGSAELNLTQIAANVSLGSQDLQRAATTGGIAAVGGALQQSAVSVNVASLGVVGTGNMQQTANDITQSMGSTLASSGGAAIATGAQSVNNKTNQIK